MDSNCQAYFCSFQLLCTDFWDPLYCTDSFMEEELRQRRPVTDEVLSDGRDEDEIDSVEQPTTQPSTEGFGYIIE